MKTSSFLAATSLAFLLLVTPLAVAAEGFAWKETEGECTDLTFDGKNVARYVHERIDLSSPERREQTYKPFHHVYDAAGENFVTKGPGGKFTHHRGIYFGFSKCRYTDPEGNSATVDTWHCKAGKGDQPGAHQTHEEVLLQEADSEKAVQRVRIHWHGMAGDVFLVEERQLTFRMGEDGALQVDFESTLTPKVDQVTLDGDPQHAGFQFRASNEVATSTAKQTYYIRPGSGKAEPGKTINWSAKSDDETTRDLPWKAMSFMVNEDERYTTVYLDHPENPKPARFSERDYGRFGSYFVQEIAPDTPLTVRYRLVIGKGERTAEECEELSRDFLGS